MLRHTVALLIALLCAGELRAQPEPLPAGPAPVEIRTLLADADGDTIPDQLGSRVRVRGVVTVPPGLLGGRNFQAFIQDGTAGLVLFSFDQQTPLVAGDVVEATGVLQQFRGSVQLQEVELHSVASGSLPAPLAVSVADADGWKHMGRRVRVDGVAGPVSLDSFGRMRLTGDDGAALTLYFPASIMRDVQWSRYPPGSRIAVTGVVSIFKQTWPYDGGFQLVVTAPEHLALIAPPQAQLPAWAPWAAAAGALLLVVLLSAVHLFRSRQRARQRELATLSALSSAIAMADLSREQLARRACQILTSYGVVEASMVHLFDERGCLLQLAASAADPALAARLDDVDVHAAGEGQHSVTSADVDRHAIEARVARQGLTLLAVHPLPSLSGTQGFLIALSPRRRRPNEMQERTLISAAKLLALALENNTIHQRARIEQEELQQLVITDPLTRLYNRRFLDEYLRVQVPLAARRGGGLSFVALDIDHFKSINDRWGHDVGDQVLVRVGNEIRQATRSADLPVRMGGEEFLVVVADGALDSVTAFAERLRGVIESLSIDDVVAGTPLRVTVSIGVAIFGMHGDTAMQLMRASDEAMYRSKRSGRNRVTVASVAGIDTAAAD